jgi:predicted metal-dependent hydrolase
MTHVVLGGLEFELRRSDRRRTMEIVVDRQGELRFFAPEDCDSDEMEAFVVEKRPWIYEKLAEKERLNPPRRPPEYVTGEGFFYLGRSHRLAIVPDDSQAAPLKLLNGRFCLRRGHVHHGTQAFTGWYTARGENWLPDRASPFIERLAIPGTQIRVMDLGFRWGSCSPDGTVNLHWAAMKLPPTIVDYILVHELSHVRIHDHSQRFWRLLERVLPDFEDRKRWLAENGAQLVRM